MYFAAFDTETGGLNPDEVDVLTLYMGIFSEDLKKVDEVYLKLRPDNGRIPVAHADALKVNGIDMKAHLEDKETITYSEARERLTAMLSKYHAKTGKYNNIKPLGYNVPFDERFMWKHILPFPQWEKFMHYKRVDVMERVDFLKECGWFPSDLAGLQTVNDFLQLPKRNAHDAKEDTLMCVDVYGKLLDIMRSKKDNSSASGDIISLLEAE
jgi:DNA polymerase III epsilon subunit-like protein